MIDIKQLVKQAFDNAASEEYNSEIAINLTATKENGVVKVYFDVDGDDRGIHGGSCVKFYDGKVVVSLCEMIEGGGLEELIEDELKQVSIDEIDPECFKTIKEQIRDILIHEMDIDFEGHIYGYSSATDKILKLFE